MANGKNSKKNARARSAQQKKKEQQRTKEPEIVCPECGGTKWEFRHDKRRIPSKWYVHAGVAVCCVVFAFFMPWFAATFAIVYLCFTLARRKVLVGTCQQCGHEQLFNAPKDGSLKPVFGDDIYRY